MVTGVTFLKHCWTQSKQYALTFQPFSARKYCSSLLLVHKGHLIYYYRISNSKTSRVRIWSQQKNINSLLQWHLYIFFFFHKNAHRLKIPLEQRHTSNAIHFIPTNIKHTLIWNFKQRSVMGQSYCVDVEQTENIARRTKGTGVVLFLLNLLTE